MNTYSSTIAAAAFAFRLSPSIMSFSIEGESMPITRDDVLKIAELARLELTPEETGAFPGAARLERGTQRKTNRARPRGGGADVALDGRRRRRGARPPERPRDP